jgi:Asp-tRNA(Asn)/Glu-tRNA(Gln) amidotransferase A subunit family amidase
MDVTDARLAENLDAYRAILVEIPDVRTLVEMGRLVSAPDYLKAEQYRTLLMDEFRRVFERVDVVVGPTTPITAWKIGEWTVNVGGQPESVLAAFWRFTYPYNLTGLSAISVPCGFDREGLPIGLQIAARPFDEPTVLRVAHAYEQAHDWKDRHPVLSAERASRSARAHQDDPHVVSATAGRAVSRVQPTVSSTHDQPHPPLAGREG